MKFLKTLLPVAAIAAVFAGCQDEDFGYNAKDIRYENEFVKMFGEVDPDQDWSMAAEITANVDLPQITGTSKMNIMTGSPKDPSTRLLAQYMLSNGQASFNFDAIKGNNSVFVTIEKDGKYVHYSQYTITDGMLNVGGVQATRANEEITRAFSSSCPTTQSTTGNYYVDAEYATYEVPDGGTAIQYTTSEGKTDVHSLSEWKEITKAGVSETNGTDYFPFTDISVRHFVLVEAIDWENSTLVLKETAEITTEDFYTWNNTTASFTYWKGLAEEQIASIQKDEYTNNPWKNSSFVIVDGIIDWENSPLELKEYAEKLPAGEAISYTNTVAGQTTPTTKLISAWKNDANGSLEGIVAGWYAAAPWENSSYSFTGEDCEATAQGLKSYKGLWPDDHFVLKKEGVEEVATMETKHIKVQYLTGVETSPAQPWNATLGNSLFGVNAFFQEGKAYYGTEKLGVFYDEAQMTEMEKGFQIHTTATGPIELPYIFGCTAYSDQLGYVYWKDDDEKKEGFDIFKLKHFILIEDGRPGSNITYDNGGTTTAITGSTFSAGCWPSIVAQNYSYTGTTYRVMYFGDDYSNTTGTYEFPAGYNIIFFISCLAQSDQPDLLFTDHNPHGFNSSFNYSIPSLNERLGHHYDQPKKYPAKKDMGQVKCLSWTRDGNTYMGFGDNCGDHDLNDMVFLVSGNFNPPATKVAPVKWHLNYDGKHHDGTNNTTKDDDLFTEYSLKIGQSYVQPQTVDKDGNVTGNSEPTRDGYKFVGWATDPTATEGSKTIEGTAVEAGTCYYAIWEIEEEPSTPEAITWIFACEDLGGSYDYDFNDLVFALKKTPIDNTNNSKLELIPLAAGGTKDDRIVYKNKEVGEIHALISGDGTSFATPINVTVGTPATAGTAITLEETIASTVSINTIKSNLKIAVYSGENSVNSKYIQCDPKSYGDKTQKVPEVLVLPEGWDWPSEETTISDIYEGFTSWVSGDASNWCNTKKEGATKFITNPLKGSGTREELTTGTYNLTVPQKGSFAASWGSTYDSYLMTVGNYSCNDESLTATITFTLETIPNDQCEIYTKDGSSLGRMNYSYEGGQQSKTVTYDITNDKLKKLVAGSFNLVMYGTGGSLASFTLEVK